MYRGVYDQPNVRFRLRNRTTTNRCDFAFHSPWTVLHLEPAAYSPGDSLWLDSGQPSHDFHGSCPALQNLSGPDGFGLVLATEFTSVATTSSVVPTDFRKLLRCVRAGGATDPRGPLVVAAQFHLDVTWVNQRNVLVGRVLVRPSCATAGGGSHGVPPSERVPRPGRRDGVRHHHRGAL